MASYGYDFYHLNFSDGDIPLAELKADNTDFCILKFTQGTSYDTGASWAQGQIPRLRGAGLVVGGYHMLDGDSSGDGRAQAAYFLSKWKPKDGDIVPIVDFEGSGQGGASLSSYKARLLDFIAAIHQAGFECMLYGHSVVKAAFSDWRASGADYWWVPGDTPHADIGPRGPDLWQYSPYNPQPGWPGNFNGRLLDCSKVITALPLVGGDDVALTDQQKADLKFVEDNRDAITHLVNFHDEMLKKFATLTGAADQIAAHLDAAPVSGGGGLTQNEADALYSGLKHKHKVPETTTE